MTNNALHVRRYDLFLELDYRNLKFEGKILVDLVTKRNVLLNSLNLNIKKARAGEDSLKFSQNGENLIVETATFDGKLEIEYSGLIQDSLVGIYRAPYNNTYLVTTQFEATNARRMFPCADRPEHKAEFKISLRIDKDLDAISNMPIESTNLEDDKKTVTFQTTPRMSTYLLYLGVGRFEEIKERLGKIDIVVASTPGRAKKGGFALEVARKSIEFYQPYFDMPYSLPKIHLISVPEFSANAMENWGAITFRETALEVDEHSSFRTRKRVAEVVAHELAHQWFGNLVTMKWWNDLWLNESFATFMAYKVVDSVFPQWRVREDFLKNETFKAMDRDSLRNTHPIEVNIESPSEIEQIFDEISYSKGANILRMIEEYMGAEDFRKGLSNYLASYKFSNATGLDL
ncbi:MAG: M1 family metallopeptidase, partial [Candidatus Thorarchaeota archaeon]